MNSDLVDRLMNRLSEQNIEYCYWKSTIFLDKVNSGESDLDLLLDRTSISDVECVLQNLGFKRVKIKWGIEPLGIYHYFGYDPNYKNFIHAHIFCELQTGESFVKSHIFPLKQMMYKDNYISFGIRRTSKSAELVIFILRYFVKFGSLPDLVFISRWYPILKEEINWLLSDVDIQESVDLLNTFCPVIHEDLFLDCINALRDHKNVLHLYLLARKVRRQLAIYKIYTRLQTAAAYLGWMRSMVLRRLTTNKHNKIPSSGGAVIAFVGADAVGKTTLTTTCQKWLKRIFPTRIVHAGKPPTSILTAPLNFTVLLARKLNPRLFTKQPTESIEQGDLLKKKPKNPSLFSIIYAIRSVSLAWDRKRIIIKSRRLASQGEIILCDRYPSTVMGAMDSPRLTEDPKTIGVVGYIYNRLARIEKGLYMRIPPPDVVLRLKASAETAQKRNQERLKTIKEDDAYLETRHQLDHLWLRPDANIIYDIDTDRSLEETILNVKKAIWESL